VSEPSDPRLVPVGPEMEKRLKHLVSLPREQRDEYRRELLERHRELHAERTEVALQSMALSQADTMDTIMASPRSDMAEFQEGPVIEFTPSDTNRVAEILEHYHRLGYAVSRVISDPNTFKIYAVFQKAN
jgi:hypothetical protein